MTRILSKRKVNPTPQNRGQLSSRYAYEFYDDLMEIPKKKTT